MEVENNQEDNKGEQFYIQVPIKKDKRTLKQVLQVVVNLKKSDTLGSAKLLSKSEAIEKSLNKLKLGKASKEEVKSLRKIFYSKSKGSKDQDREREELDARYPDDLAFDDTQPKVQQVVYEICMQRYDEVLKTIQDEESRKLMKDMVKQASDKKEKIKNSQNQIMDEKIKETIELADVKDELFEEVVELAEASASKYPPKGKKNRKKKKKLKKIKKEEEDNENKNENSGDNTAKVEKKKDDPIRDQILKEIREKNKNKFENLKSSLDSVEKQLAELGNFIESLKNKQIPILKTKINERDPNLWTEIASTNFYDVGKYLTDFVSACFVNSKAKDQFSLVNLFPILCQLLSAVNWTLNQHQMGLQKIAQILQTKEKVQIEVSKHGNKGIEAMNKKYKENEFKKTKKFVDKEKWEKMCAMDKIANSFTNKDYNQFPRVYLWRQLSNEERAHVIETHIEWRRTRMPELIQAFKEKKEKSIKNIDTFMYYQENLLDCQGKDIRFTTEEKNMLKIQGDDAEIYNELKRIWNEEGEKRHIYNRVFVKGVPRRTWGKKSTYANLGFKTKNVERKINAVSDQPVVYQVVTPIKPKMYTFRRGAFAVKRGGPVRFGTQTRGTNFIGNKRRSDNQNEHTINLREESPDNNRNKKLKSGHNEDF